jgi:subtilisin family serine protease
MSHRSVWITPEEAMEAIRAGSGRGIKIAVIDSGVELSHPELRHMRLTDDVAFELSENRTVNRLAGWGIDKFGHGTAVAAAIRRCAPEAQIGSFRVLDHKLSSKFDIIREAARLAIDRGYHILNCSFGGKAALADIGHFKPWIDSAYRHGVHVVSACNNYHFREAEWPGHFPSVITVNMAKIKSDELIFRWDVPQGSFAQHLVEFAARGVDLELPWKEGRTETKTGSSYAAPHVAGLLARLLSKHPGLKPPVAKALLQEIALPWQPEWMGPNH